MLDAIPKDWWGPIITGVFAIFIALLTWLGKRAEASKARREAREKDERDREHREDMVETQDITVRIKMLMDGYEARVKELSAELIATKDENRVLHAEIAALKRGEHA